MPNQIPTIDRYMSAHPHTIGKEQSLSFAHKLMREHHIRHLPVLEGRQLVGVVSERDLHLVETLRDVDPDQVMVEDAMSMTPYIVAPDAPIDEVVGEMVAHKYGSAVVLDRNEVVGVFTTIDAMTAFAELLHHPAG
jgi:acetoin utilization protein AcuB